MRQLLLIASFLIFVLGLVMIFSASSAEVLDQELCDNTHIFAARQIGYGLIGLALAVGISRVGRKTVVSWSPYLFWFFVFLLILTLVPGVGKVVNGSRRWIGIGSLSFQPSEFVKYIVPAFFIYRFTSCPEDQYTLRRFLVDIFLCLIPIGLIVIEPNNGTAAVVASTLLTLCLLMQIPAKYWAAPLLVIAVVGGIFALQLPYVTGRIDAYLHPELDLRGKGHQPHQAKIAAGSGKLFGKGVGNSLQKLSYLPEAQNDYIAAIFAEEFGFFGVTGLILCYMLIGFIGFNKALQANDPQEFYLMSVITFLISFQAFLNLGVVSGTLPSTGLNLPLFSQGGTSLIANIAGISLIWARD